MPVVFTVTIALPEAELTDSHVPPDAATVNVLATPPPEADAV